MKKILHKEYHYIIKYSYKKNIEASIELMKEIDLGIKTFFGVCTGWDNTPRYGERGYIVDGATPGLFKHYLKTAKILSEKMQQEFIFISCWNEWCEGMVLEPTKKDGYAYLQAIKEIFLNGENEIIC